ncbi:MAG TPA: alpha-amylase family glycosyl hydrolase [Caulobacteraceae bacterium]|nr:alpha-amylase family glycosyl hydrolase [Caulobacteraceae bacterium]
MDERGWWRRGVVYQIYPRSFQDTDGDGIGDLPGIERRLDHVAELGVDAIWISPFYPSPMADFGYDVADYCGVDPIFGTLQDFDRLLGAAHARGLKVIVDFVPNHTSEAHPWFVESRASRESRRRDWYVWRDPAPDGGPPNNWLSVFGGGAWELDPATGQYFLHSYLKQQPDLNWRNPEVEAAVFEALRFWLDRGVDGFRMDVLWMLVKDEQFRDNPRNPDWRPGMLPHLRFDPVFSTDRPETMGIVRRMRALLDSYAGERVLIGEIYLPIRRLVAYYGEASDGCHMPFNFKLIQARWDAGEIDALVRRYEGALQGAWPNWVLGNHDNPRLASRIGPQAARAAAVLLLTLRGTPTLYYGDELGMENVPIPPERAVDPWERNEPGMGLGRDPERTPMPWDDGPNRGFTDGEPWLPPGPAAVNVAAQADEPGSMLTLYRRLLALRRAEPALHEGDWVPLGVQGEVLLYARQAPDAARFAVAVNFGDGPARVEHEALRGTMAVTTTPGREGEAVEGVLTLEANGAAVVRCG